MDSDSPLGAHLEEVRERARRLQDANELRSLLAAYPGELEHFEICRHAPERAWDVAQLEKTVASPVLLPALTQHVEPTPAFIRHLQLAIARRIVHHVRDDAIPESLVSALHLLAARGFSVQEEAVETLFHSLDRYSDAAWKLMLNLPSEHVSEEMLINLWGRRFYTEQMRERMLRHPVAGVRLWRAAAEEAVEDLNGRAGGNAAVADNALAVLKSLAEHEEAVRDPRVNALLSEHGNLAILRRALPAALPDSFAARWREMVARGRKLDLRLAGELLESAPEESLARLRPEELRSLMEHEEQAVRLQAIAAYGRLAELVERTRKGDGGRETGGSPSPSRVP